jgi:hypothetical protein
MSRSTSNNGAEAQPSHCEEFAEHLHLLFANRRVLETEDPTTMYPWGKLEMLGR